MSTSESTLSPSQGLRIWLQLFMATLIKKNPLKQYKEIQKRSGAKSCMTNGLLIYALQRQNAEFFFLKQIFPEKEYRGLSPNFHIHVSVSELYIPTMGLPVLLEEICRILVLYKSLRDT